MSEELPGEYVLREQGYLEMAQQLGEGLDGPYAHWRTIEQLARETDFTEMELRSFVPHSHTDNNPLCYYWAVLPDGTRKPVAQVEGVREYFLSWSGTRTTVPVITPTKTVQAWTIDAQDTVQVRRSAPEDVQDHEYLLLEHAALVSGKSTVTLRQALKDKVLASRESPITGTQVLIRKLDLDALSAGKHYSKQRQAPSLPASDTEPISLMQAASLAGVNYEALAQAAKRGKLAITYGPRNGGKERLTTLAAIATWRAVKYLRA